MPTTVRLQFDVPYDKVHEIQTLMEACGFETRKDLFNNALTLLKWVVRQAQKGSVIAAVDEKQEKYTELGMPFIEHVKETSSTGTRSVYAAHG